MKIFTPQKAAARRRHVNARDARIYFHPSGLGNFVALCPKILKKNPRHSTFALAECRLR